MAEDRLAVLESTVNEHSLTLAALRESGARVEQRLDSVDARMERFEARMERFEARMDARLDRIDARFDRIESRFEQIDDKLFRMFVWVVGIQITVMLVVVGSVVSVALVAPR